MKRALLLALVAGASLLATASARADWWFHRSANYNLGPDYRFPDGTYARMDFYYGYTGRPLVAPWWINQPPTMIGGYMYDGYVFNPAGPPFVPIGYGMESGDAHLLYEMPEEKEAEEVEAETEEPAAELPPVPPAEEPTDSEPTDNEPETPPTPPSEE